MDTTVQLPFANSYAFLIGINAYEQVPKLDSPIPDVERLGQQLANQHGFEVSMRPWPADYNHRTEYA